MTRLQLHERQLAKGLQSILTPEQWSGLRAETGMKCHLECHLAGQQRLCGDLRMFGGCPVRVGGARAPTDDFPSWAWSGAEEGVRLGGKLQYQ